MEFYAFTQKELAPEYIKTHLRIDNLNHYCASVSEIINSHEEEGEIYCTWGLFQVHREIIKKGIRISLLNCPNALTFTITREGKDVVIHCTINTDEADQGFIESIKIFLTHLKQGIDQL